MNDHGRLLIFGGMVVVIAAFLLIAVGIVNAYRTAHPNRPYEPNHARNIVLGFAGVVLASALFAALSSS